MNKIVARKVVRERSPELVKEDLERYCQKALEWGASDVKVIPAREVVVDERVRIKCQVPRCHLYGESANCPPHAPSLEEIRKVLNKYEQALLLKRDVIPKEDFIDDKKWHRGHIVHQRKIHDIVSRIESLAFNDGYYFALAFGAGGCKTALCSGEVCQFLDSGRCRFPLKSRPSMEGVGIDVFDLTSRVGWDTYPVASRAANLESIPCALSIGIVFIY